MYGESLLTNLKELCNHQSTSMDSAYMQSFLLFGPNSVGKSWAVKNLSLVLEEEHRYVKVLDCSSLDSAVGKDNTNWSVQAILHYMEMEYERAVRFGNSSLLILDNIHALCPSGSG